MKLKYDVKIIIFKIMIILFCILINGIIYFRTLDFQLTIVTIIFALAIISGIFIYDKLFKSYMTSILEELSDMISTIADMRNELVFSTTDDTILSKLQSQTLKLTNILVAQNKKMEEDKNEIKTLISDIAHQLKTPLSTIKMYSELLQDDTLTVQERTEFNDIVLLSLNKLSFLVESMIKMSRLESGIIRLKPQLVLLNETILSAIGEVQRKARNKDINIKFNEIDKVKILHDKNWTSEAIFNILENAVKYTDESGEIEITLQKYEMFCRVDIKDNGMGISEDELTKIFIRFYRGVNTNDIEGIGIGLYLTREILTRQGGYIKVNSILNEGSTFSLFFKI